MVQYGDSLSRIAQRFNTTVGTLAQLNGIVNINVIQVGQVLKLPGSSPNTPATPAPTPVPATQTYVVRPGDSLFRISLQFGVPVAALVQANNITDPNRIFVGQTLIIP